MKQLLCMMLMLLLGNYATVKSSTPDNSVVEIQLTESDDRELAKGNDTTTYGRPQVRGIAPQSAYAYIYNKVVSIDFTETFSCVVVTITKESTGAVVRTETSSNPSTLNIPLNGESSGSYRIEIEADGVYMEGVFTL